MMKHRSSVALALSLLAIVWTSSSAPQPRRATVEGASTDHSLGELVVRGDGDVPMLLVPCMSGRWVQWEPFMDRNRERYRMYAVTLPGYGGTAGPEALPADTDTPWHDAALDSLGALLEREELEGVVVVGHSWGSSIAVRLAARHPERVRAVVNVDGWMHQTAEEEARTLDERRALARSVRTEQAEELADPEAWRRFNWVSFADRERSQLYHGMFMATDRAALLRYWSENAFVELNELLRSDGCPVLDVVSLSKGAGDPAALRRAHTRELETLGLARRVRSVFLDETGHFVMEERPAELDTMIAEFLAAD